MNWQRGRNLERTAAVADLRRREDEAPRLRDEVPRLVRLRLLFEDVPTEAHLALRRYTKPVIVGTAPAHFEVHCMEPRCDGYHDLTGAIMRGLQQSRPLFSGESECHGLVDDAQCSHALVFRAEASYQEQAADTQRAPTADSSDSERRVSWR